MTDKNIPFVPPTPPTILIELMRMLKDPDTAASQIAALIGKDPGLTGHILRSINSSFFGVAERVGSLLQAVALLGNRTLKMVSLAYCLKKFVRDASTGGFDYNGFWQFSLAAGTAANLLANELETCSADEAFVGGLMSRIGCPAIFQKDPEAYKAIVAGIDEAERPLFEAEREQFGTDHAEVSAAILAEWQLPDHMIEAVRCQYELDRCTTPKAEAVAKILVAARLMAFCISKRNCQETYRTMLMHCVEKLDFEFDQAEDLFRKVSGKIDEAAGLFAVTVSGGEDVETIMADAHKHMEELQSEVDSVVTELRETAAL